MTIQARLISLFCCVLLFTNATAQELSRLVANIKGARTDSQITKAYLDLVKYYTPLNSDSAYYYGEEGLRAAVTRKDIAGEAELIASLGRTDQAQGRLELGRERTGYALKLYQRIDKATGIAAMHNSLGAIEATLGNANQAMPHFLKALHIYDSIKTDLTGIMTANLNIGCLYLQNGDTTNCDKYFAVAERISKQLPVSDITISLYNYIGVLNLVKGNIARGMEYFNENIRISNKPEFMASHVEALEYLGSLYNDMGDRKKAMEYLEKALAIAREKKFVESQADILLLMGTTLAPADHEKGLDYMQQALTTSEQINSKTLKMDIYKEMAKVYEGRGDYKSANALLKQQQAVKDSAAKLNKVRELSSLGAVYELDRSNSRIEEVSAQRNIIVGFSAVIALILVAVVFLYIKTRRLNKELVRREAELIDLGNTKNKLFSIIGHDLRWPVARIPTILDIVDDETLGDDEKKYLIDSLKEHTKATVETLDKLLYWGKSLMNGTQVAPEWFNPKQYVLQTIDLRRMAAAEKDIRIIDHVPDNIELFSDPTHFDFIIRNLFGNAIKFTGAKGQIIFDVDTRQWPGYYVFSVTDNGVGIDEGRLKKIFEPFNSKAGTANEKGTGIGLMLCKEFAVRNGGDIWATSTSGQGSTFYLSVKMMEKTA